MNPSRRSVLGLLALAALPLPACVSTAPCPAPPVAPPRPSLPRGLLPEDLRLLASPGEALALVQRAPGGRGVLRSLARVLTPADDVTLLQRRLRASLAATLGVGIAAPQVGLGVRAALVMLGARPSTPGGVTQPHVEFYLNPRIVERSDEVTLDYEGCLSVPDVCGLVHRSRFVVVEHGLPGEKPAVLEASGFDARIFQHELDHLDGVLFIDRVEGGVQPKDQLKELRERLRKEHPETAALEMRDAYVTL